MTTVLPMALGVAVALCASILTAQTKPTAVVALSDEAAARIIVDAPLAEPLTRGLVVIQYRTENLRVVPVYGPKALDVSPRIGHLHITVDDLPWHWVDASGEPIVIQYLPAGPHKVLIELANANHHVLDQGVVNFVVPERVVSTHQ